MEQIPVSVFFFLPSLFCTSLALDMGTKKSILYWNFYVCFFFLIVALCLELWFYCYKIQSHNFLKLGFSFPTMTNIHNTNHDIFSMCIIKTYKDKEKKVVNPIKEHCMFIIFTNDTAFIWVCSSLFSVLEFLRVLLDRYRCNEFLVPWPWIILLKGQP